MKCLIVEDDVAARELLKSYLSAYGDCTVVVDGHKAVKAVRAALEAGQPYDLICLDIMMAEMDGQEALKAIRQTEKQWGIGQLDRVKVIMTTALDNTRHIRSAFKSGCEAYLIKPIKKEELLEELREFGLIGLKVSG